MLGGAGMPTWNSPLVAVSQATALVVTAAVMAAGTYGAAVVDGATSIGYAAGAGGCVWVIPTAVTAVSLGQRWATNSSATCLEYLHQESLRIA